MRDRARRRLSGGGPVYPARAPRPAARTSRACWRAETGRPAPLELRGLPSRQLARSAPSSSRRHETSKAFRFSTAVPVNNLPAPARPCRARHSPEFRVADSSPPASQRREGRVHRCRSRFQQGRLHEAGGRETVRGTQGGRRGARRREEGRGAGRAERARQLGRAPPGRRAGRGRRPAFPLPPRCNSTEPP